MEEEVPKYDDESSVDSSDSFSISSQGESEKLEESSNEYENTEIAHDRDENGGDDSDTAVISGQERALEKTMEKWQSFLPKLGSNYIHLDEANPCLYIGLKQGQEVVVSGCFELKILKGGITYNNVHYSASNDRISIWHPLSASISPFCGSFYAGWDEKVFLDQRVKSALDINELECVLKISNWAKNIEKLGHLAPTYDNLWVPSDYLLDGVNASDAASFALICSKTVRNLSSVRTMTLTAEWLKIIGELQLYHKTCQQDMRIMTVGGKSSGKSTFSRLLLQNFLHGDRKSTDSILYLDLDQGQPEFSDPDCVSLCKLSNELALGCHFGQGSAVKLAECYVGSPSPQDFPAKYLDMADFLIDELEKEVFMGTSLLNLPGWIKGYGIQIVNHLISKFKPTHIIFLESPSSRAVSATELRIPDSFHSLQREHYTTSLHHVTGFLGHSHDSPPERFQASHLRTARLLYLFHKSQIFNHRPEYDFKPLITQPPLQISFGSAAGVRAFHFTQEGLNLHADDIVDSLEGCMVGIFVAEGDFKADLIGNFPVLKSFAKLRFVSLGLIHSISSKDAYVNIYIPFTKREMLLKQKNSNWVLQRAKTSTPIHELYPAQCSKVFNSFGEVPFVSSKKGRGLEHIWKVRRNILRRGHQ
ncbi:LAMI_0F05072g1_1 [Lachancea mirantina]|uniref:Polynucleotide 5'-hydroxyl-kinase GRC3 n=1 Tax=Lachancea mirantina TaxID=1230905 RepID=A0A1G4JYE0_9SACH|nr:LAMI_0F05072g1_1 [Lachancea mirantina]